MGDLHDLAAERSLLGGVMLNDARYGEACELIDDASFYRGAHRTIWQTIVDLHADADIDTADMVAVADRLESAGRLEAVGGYPTLASMLADTPTSTGVQRDAARVHELARRRQIQTAAAELGASVADVTVDVDQTLEDALERLTRTSAGSQGGLVDVDDVSDAVWALRTDGRVSDAVDTGWRNVDTIWRPSPGKLTIVTGWPSHGKSSWLDALTVNLARIHGWRTGFWSIEQAPTSEHVARLAGIAANADFDGLAYDQLDRHLSHIGEHFTWVNHDVHTTIPAILGQIRIAHRRRPLHVAVIDPWTDIDLPRPAGWRQDEVIQEALVRCFRFARATGIHMFVVVHPKQRDRHADGTLPIATANDLHGGSMYNKFCDSLLSVWRDEQSATRPETEADVHVLKVRRNGIDGQMGRHATLVMRPTSGVYQPAARHLQAI